MASRAAYDASSAAAFGRAWRDAGHAVAYTRDYGGEFNFEGRLIEPFDVIGRDRDAPQPGAPYSRSLRGTWLSIEAVRS